MDSDVHFSLVVASQDFLLRVRPFGHPEARDALDQFVRYLKNCNLPSTGVDAVLLRCLAALDRSTGWFPTLVDRYLAEGDMTNCAERFAACIENLLLYKAVADPVVARAMVLMSRRYGESDLRSKVATAVGASTTALNRSFERTLGVTLVEYLKDLRLRRAAELLHSTHKRIKEIWVEVGYNDDSNFNHDFKEKFGLSPTNYRTRAICVSPIMRSEDKPQAPPKRDEAARVLLVDDDVEGITIVARYLTIEGYVVAIASNAQEAVKEAMRFAPHVVLLDHRLGAGADGIECLYALRREQLSRQPAVALLTGDWDVTSRTSELQNLNATLLFKPCDVEMIQALVARLAA